MAKKTIAAFFNNDPAKIDYVYAQGRQQQIAERTDLFPHIVSEANFATHAADLQELDVIFSTWGMWAPTAAQFAALPKLKAVFYAAGSVKGFAPAFLQRDIEVVSAWAANAVPVAEFTVAQIILACKGYFQDTRRRRAGTGSFCGRGCYGERIALIGAGQIGRKVIELLRPYCFEIVVCDPYLSAADAESLGVSKVEMPEAFATAYVVSNHVPNLPSLQGIYTAELFAAMRQDATFINTGRGAQVVEPDLIDVFARRPDLTALLDVTFPEPPAPDSPLLSLANVIISSHIAGSTNDEVVRMADYMLAEFQAWQNAQPRRYAVSMSMLETMA